MLDIDRIGEFTEGILQTVEKKFAENDVELPERRYIAVGDVGGTVHDDEQVTVSFGTTSRGLPSDNMPSMNPCNEPYKGTFSVEIVRCTPQPTGTGPRGYAPPSPEDISAYAKERMRDSAVLTQAAEEIGSKIFTKTVMYNIEIGPDSGKVQAIRMNITSVVV